MALWQRREGPLGNLPAGTYLATIAGAGVPALICGSGEGPARGGGSMKAKVLVRLFAAVALFALAQSAWGQTLKAERYGSIAAFKARLAGFPV